MIRQIFCIWSGNNTMSEARQDAFETIKKHCGCNVTLLTTDNISNFVKNDHKLHEAYNYLSLTHKSDYLRIYMMCHHGGGYSDIKRNSFDWNPYFDQLYSSNMQFIGYQEKSMLDIASDDLTIKNSFLSLAGNGHYIFKPQTEIAKSCLLIMEKILDAKFDDLKKNPGDYHPRAVYGGVYQGSGFESSRYPLTWNELLGRNFHKTCYENIGQFLLTMPFTNFCNYR